MILTKLLFIKDFNVLQQDVNFVLRELLYKIFFIKFLLNCLDFDINIQTHFYSTFNCLCESRECSEGKWQFRRNKDK